MLNRLKMAKDLYTEQVSGQIMSDQSFDSRGRMVSERERHWRDGGGGNAVNGVGLMGRKGLEEQIKSVKRHHFAPEEKERESPTKKEMMEGAGMEEFRVKVRAMNAGVGGGGGEEDERTQKRNSVQGAFTSKGVGLVKAYIQASHSGKGVFKPLVEEVPGSPVSAGSKVFAAAVAMGGGRGGKNNKGPSNFAQRYALDQKVKGAMKVGSPGFRRQRSKTSALVDQMRGYLEEKEEEARKVEEKEERKNRWEKGGGRRSNMGSGRTRVKMVKEEGEGKGGKVDRVPRKPTTS